jgi:20S proteasome subunit beta 4
MDFLMGIKGPDFVIVASDTAAVQQVIAIKHDEDKIVPIDTHKVMGVSGEPGDRVKFSEYINANVKLYAYRNGIRYVVPTRWEYRTVEVPVRRFAA